MRFDMFRYLSFIFHSTTQLKFCSYRNIINCSSARTILHFCVRNEHGWMDKYQQQRNGKPKADEDEYEQNQ